MTRFRPGDMIALTLLLIAAAVAVFVGGHDVTSFGLTELSMAAVVQAAYGDRLEPAVAGMIANMTTDNRSTRNCESAAIGFGLAVGQGTEDRGCVLGGTLATFVGVSIRDITLIHETADQYEEGDNVGVFTQGEIWVQTTVATSPTDVVHYDATTGEFAISGGSGPIVGARWMVSRAAGLGLLRLSGHLPVP